MYGELLKIPILNALLPKTFHVQNCLKSEGNLLLFLHPIFTPDGISLCPAHVFELMCEVYWTKYHVVPTIALLQTLIDVTLMGRGGLCGLRVLTPYWFTLFPSFDQVFADLEETILLDNYFLLGLFLQGDDHFPVVHNCGHLIEFHKSLYKNNEKTDVFLLMKKYKIQVERLLVTNKCCLKSLEKTESEGTKLFNWTICQCNRKNLFNGDDHQSVEADESVTVFLIHSKNLFDDI